MARGKHLSPEEARKKDQLDRFCKEHPSKGDEKEFNGDHPKRWLRRIELLHLPTHNTKSSNGGHQSCHGFARSLGLRSFRMLSA